MSRARDLLLRAAGGTDGSLAARFRRKRFRHVRELFAAVPPPRTILDVGGTPGYWETVGLETGNGTEIVMLNLEAADVDRPGMRAVAGTATDMRAFADREFDVAFSNSVIEHVGALPEQRRMAAEMMRVAKRYYVQTPNRYFPIEPHFMFPFFALLPVGARAFLVRHLALGWYSRTPDREESLRIARSIRLLTRKEMASLFPGARMVRERFFGFTKSFSVFGGDW